MTIEQFIQQKLAEPKAFKVVTSFASGRIREHLTATRGQAHNYAVGERRKIGRDLINRETGEMVRVVSVEVVAI